MSTDRDLTRIVRSWLQTDEHESANRVLDNVFDRLDTTPQRRPLWRAWRDQLMSSSLKFAAAGLAVVLVAGIGLAIYFSRPTVPPAASPSAAPSLVGPTIQPSQTTTPSPTATLAPAGTPIATVGGAKAPWVAFYWNPDDEFRNSYPWVMRADGSASHMLSFGSLASFDWSDDGSQIVALGNGDVRIADVGDDIGEFVDTGFNTDEATACIEKSREPFPCQDAGVAFSPDATKVVLVQRCTYELPGCMFLTVIHFNTGERVELSDTLGPKVPVGDRRLRLGLERPVWSPDGTQIAFTRRSSESTIDEDATSIYVINADGTGLHEIDLGGGIHATDIEWSPDGTEIAFTGFWSPADQPITDIWTVHPDGNALVNNTNTGTATDPDWISSSEIRFRVRRR